MALCAGDRRARLTQIPLVLGSFFLSRRVINNIFHLIKSNNYYDIGFFFKFRINVLV